MTLSIPLRPELADIIARTEMVGVDTFLVGAFQRPFSANGFGNRFRKWCDEAGLRHCSAHGLRKAAAAPPDEHPGLRAPLLDAQPKPVAVAV